MIKSTSTSLSCQVLKIEFSVCTVNIVFKILMNGVWKQLCTKVWINFCLVYNAKELVRVQSYKNLSEIDYYNELMTDFAMQYLIQI